MHKMRGRCHVAVAAMLCGLAVQAPAPPIANGRNCVFMGPFCEAPVSAGACDICRDGACGYKTPDYECINPPFRYIVIGLGQCAVSANPAHGCSEIHAICLKRSTCYPADHDLDDIPEDCFWGAWQPYSNDWGCIGTSTGGSWLNPKDWSTAVPSTPAEEI